MEVISFDASELRHAYRERVTTLPNHAVHRKLVDRDIVLESCIVCLDGWDLGDDVVTLRCECPSWA